MPGVIQEELWFGKSPAKTWVQIKTGMGHEESEGKRAKSRTVKSNIKEWRAGSSLNQKSACFREMRTRGLGPPRSLGRRV